MEKRPGAAPEAELAAAARDGDSRAMEVLFSRHFRRVAALIARLLGDRGDAGDLAQEAFVHALESMRTLQNPEAFAPWLNAIAVRTVRRELRRRKLARALGLRSRAPLRAEALAAAGASPEDRAELARLQRALSALPASHQVALVLRRVEGHTLPEIARLLDVSLATVKRWIVRAERQIGEGP